MWSDPDLHQTAAEFFKEFSRTEYALKAAGWVRAGRDGEAQVDWDRFGREVGPRLMARSAARSAAEYIFRHPPKKQVFRGGALEWEESPVAQLPDGQRLLVLLRRIRNNLFHGGKFNGRWLEPERSYELISRGLVVLRACREADAQLRRAYDG